MEGDTRRCPNCGSHNRTTAKFCVTCGVRIPDEAPAARDPFTATPATATWPAPPSAAAQPAVAEPASVPAPSGWGGWGAPTPAAEPPTAARAIAAEEVEFDIHEAIDRPAPAADPGIETPGDDALGQAIELLDTLRDLLPTVLASAGGTAVGNAAAVLAQTSDDDYSALRAMVAEATERPRDIDVMIRLSQRIGDITDLLAERDRLRAALRGR